MCYGAPVQQGQHARPSMPALLRQHHKLKQLKRLNCNAAIVASRTEPRLRLLCATAGQLKHHGITHFKFFRLTRNGHRKSIDALDIAWNFVMGDLIFAK